MSKHIVCIVGNPNCGKTTLFNAITGSKQEVGNWPGVTVEKKVGHYSHDGHDISLVDLPGIYSVTPPTRRARMNASLATISCPERLRR